MKFRSTRIAKLLQIYEPVYDPLRDSLENAPDLSLSRGRDHPPVDQHTQERPSRRRGVLA